MKKKKKKSPALTPEAAAAFLRPFFLMMKLAPMNPLDSKAKINPFRFSLVMLKISPSLFRFWVFLFFFFFSSSKICNNKLFPGHPRLQICCEYSVFNNHEVGNSYCVKTCTTILFVNMFKWAPHFRKTRFFFLFFSFFN